MKIVLNRDIKNLGKVGEVCEVADGYGRNFLLPKGYAIVASKANIEKLNKKIEELKAKNSTLENEAKEIALLLEKEVFNVVRQSADDDTIYGSVKNRDVYKMIEGFLVKNNKKFVFDLSGIKIENPIKSLGQYKIFVSLFGDISVYLRLNVCRAVSDFESDVVVFDKKLEDKVLSIGNDANKAKGVVGKLNEFVEKKNAKMAEKQAKIASKKAKKATSRKHALDKDEQKKDLANGEDNRKVVEDIHTDSTGENNVK